MNHLICSFYSLWCVWWVLRVYNFPRHRSSLYVVYSTQDHNDAGTYMIILSILRFW